MTMADFWRRLARQGAGEGAGGGGAGGGADTAAGGGQGGDTAAGGGQGADTAAGGGQGARWWEDASWSDEDRRHLTAKGLTVDDPMEALRKVTGMYRNAEARLGKPADAIIEKPKQGQDVSEWIAANRTALGLPDKPEGYTVEPPKDWPKDAAWDKDFEAQARQLAFEAGVPPKAFQGMVGLYAAKVKALNDAAEAQLAADDAKMREALEKDWGQQLDARLQRARQAAGVVAEKAGLDAEGLAAISEILSTKAGGSAAALKLFDAIGAMLGEDEALGLRAGAKSFGMTPAEARAELARMYGPDGEMFKATQSGEAMKVKEVMKRVEQLTKLAAG